MAFGELKKFPHSLRSMICNAIISHHMHDLLIPIESSKQDGGNMFSIRMILTESTLGVFCLYLLSTVTYYVALRKVIFVTESIIEKICTIAILI